MDLSKFYDRVRADLFGGALTAPQVRGTDAIVHAWDRYGDGVVQREAVCLATAFHETDKTMAPIYEYGPRAYFNKYEPGTKLGKILGNTLPGDGYRFRGVGLVMLTGRSNFVRVGKKIGVDLVAHPECLATDLALAARILVQGSLEGWFTGKGLASYVDAVDESDDEELREFIASRRVINGTDKAALIGGYALKFESALKAAGR